MKRIISALLLCLLVLSLLPVGAMATETTEATESAPIREPGYCGDDLTWSYDSGTLTISGSGEMDHYPDGDAPWLEYKESITSLVISGNVTSIGEGAFADYDSLTQVYFGTAMHTIHRQAFKGCDGLTDFDLPATFRRFGEESFMGCTNLVEIRCKGPMPSFNGNCLWDTYVTIFYPTTNPWPSDPVVQLYNAFQGRIEFYMGEGTMGGDDNVPVQTNPPATEAVPETTAPATEPEVTEAVTEEPTVEITEAPTQAPTEATEETVKEPEWIHETQPPEEEKPEKQGMNGIWFGLFLVTGILSLILIGALVFRRRSY